MKTIVIRSAAVFAAVAMAVFGLLGAASAQTNYAPTTPSSPILPDPGSFANTVTTGPIGVLGFGGVDAQPTVPEAATDDDTVGGTGGGLALTGSSASLPAAVALGLLAAGGTAVVAARKREDI